VEIKIMGKKAFNKIISEENSLVLIDISREETENLNFTRIDTLLNHIQGKDGHNRVLLSFDYNKDQREIYEIDEIVMYVLQLYKNHRNLFYFLHTNNYQGLVFLYCLTGVKVVSKNPEETKVELTDPDMVAAVKNSIIKETRVYGKAIDDIQGAEYSLKNLFP